MTSLGKIRSPKRPASSRTPTKRGTPEKRVSRAENRNVAAGTALLGLGMHSSATKGTSDFETNFQDLLCSKEIMRSSPELWPEKMPGVVEFATLYGTSPILSKSEAAASSLDSALEKDDHDMLQEFGSLTTTQLMEKVKALQNLAYQLGLEEAREMTRGKFLNILGKPSARR